MKYNVKLKSSCSQMNCASYRQRLFDRLCPKEALYRQRSGHWCSLQCREWRVSAVERRLFLPTHCLMKESYPTREQVPHEKSYSGVIHPPVFSCRSKLRVTLLMRQPLVKVRSLVSQFAGKNNSRLTAEEPAGHLW